MPSSTQRASYDDKSGTHQLALQYCVIGAAVVLLAARARLALRAARLVEQGLQRQGMVSYRLPHAIMSMCRLLFLQIMHQAACRVYNMISWRFRDS